jgi:signal transduction histidine kinase
VESVTYHEISDPQKLHALLDAVLLVESGLELDGILPRIVEAGRFLTDARYGALGVLDPARKKFERFVHKGMDEDAVGRIGRLPEGRGVLGKLIAEARPLRIRDLAQDPSFLGFPKGHPQMRSLLGVPLLVHSGEVYGILYLADKDGGKAFTKTDEALVVALARAAGIAVENARLHAQVAELALVQDRERIAMDLHDTVIQRLFGVGLHLQTILPLLELKEERERIADAVTELDEVIRQVRTTIFALDMPPPARGGLRAQVLDVCAQAASSLGFDPEIRFQGPIDRLVPSFLIPEILAALREALANVARHAQAGRVQVELSADNELRLVVTDDGVGPKDHPPRGKHRGIANLADRAAAYGGSFELRRGPRGGAIVVWRVPLSMQSRGGALPGVLLE